MQDFDESKTQKDTMSSVKRRSKNSEWPIGAIVTFICSVLQANSFLSSVLPFVRIWIMLQQAGRIGGSQI